LNISLTNKNLEIGWTWYSPEVWRTRVNTECKYLLLRYCFEALQLVRVQLKADIRNSRSNAAILRIGAVREGELRQDRILHDGFRRNAYIYSVLDTEWLEVRRRLEEFLSI
jgi:RimJ/RimL family protein N-acetyltransferase